MNLPPLSALRVFEATARHLSFSRAGDELFVTHAAVSHQIRNLEEWFETRLFLRRGRGVELTRSGEMLFRHVSPALADIAETCSRVKALGEREKLTVGCIPSIASRWLVPNLNLFTSEHADLDLRVVYASANQKLSESGLDVLITLGREERDGLASNRLISRITKPVCSPAFLERHGPFESAGMLADIPLLHDESRAGWQHWFQQAGVAWPADDSWPVYQDFNMLLGAAIAGHGVALCPVDAFRLEIGRGDLVIVSDVAVNQDAAYYASFRKSAGSAALEFVDWFTKLTADSSSQNDPAFGEQGDLAQLY